MYQIRYLAQTIRNGKVLGKVVLYSLMGLDKDTEKQ